MQRFKDPNTRKMMGVILAGKMLGIVALLAIIKALGSIFGAEAGASTVSRAAVEAADTINPINTMWVLVAAFLVFFMQAGFMALEAGFARSREAVNVLMECVFDTCLCGILFWAIGFAFMFGGHFTESGSLAGANGLIGHEYFFLSGGGADYNGTGIAFLAFFLFQLAFADTASTITSGAMVGRTSFKGDILYSICVSGFLYPIFGHWVWGPGGWLGNTMGWFNGLVPEGTVFRDFAGSTVVHTTGGVIALAGAIALGPRLGRKFARDGGGLFPPHDLVMASIGAVILWFGWYGFNPGSTLSAMDWEGIGRVAGNTTLAACAGGMVAVLFVYPRSKKWDLGMSLNGFLGGLVAITAPCYWVSPLGAVIIGALAGIIVPLGVDLLEHLRIDDPIGAVPVHFICGIFGTLAVGLFATGQYGIPTSEGPDNSAPIEGLFYGGGGGQLLAQIIGSLSCIIVVGGLAMIIMKLLRLIPGSWNLRISRDEELEGIDVVEHGLPPYHLESGAGVIYITPTSPNFDKEPASAPASTEKV
ncbi:ammonium transporter [Dermatobacter hominis]|uniref:ammonium transporter n=1 Tax=Dermatobacter hominis TaxID=2884263 RepID=UPI001D1219FB|nr:ammonium transporter [Dermatobacter hominis]UDY37090.1 ammonium transporter [Dermatobacter hominis]